MGSIVGGLYAQDPDPQKVWERLGAYVGNPNAHNIASSIYLGPLLKSLGTRNLFSASTLDQMPKHVSSGLMFGHPSSIPIPDVDHTDYLLMLGANPVESNTVSSCWRLT